MIIENNEPLYHQNDFSGHSYVFRFMMWKLSKARMEYGTYTVVGDLMQTSFPWTVAIDIRIWMTIYNCALYVFHYDPDRLYSLVFILIDWKRAEFAYNSIDIACIIFVLPCQDVKRFECRILGKRYLIFWNAWLFFSLLELGSSSFCFLLNFVFCTWRLALSLCYFV